MSLEKNGGRKESFVFKDDSSLIMFMAEGNSWFKNTEREVGLDDSRS